MYLYVEQIKKKKEKKSGRLLALSPNIALDRHVVPCPSSALGSLRLVWFDMLAPAEMLGRACAYRILYTFVWFDTLASIRRRWVRVAAAGLDLQWSGWICSGRVGFAVAGLPRCR